MKNNKFYLVQMLFAVLVAFASCKNGNQTVTPDNPDTPAVTPVTKAFVLTPISIGSIDATIKVTPNNENGDKYYSAFVIPKVDWIKRGGEEGIHDWQKSWWKRDGEAQFHEYMMEELFKGEKVFNMVADFKFSLLKWDCDYVFYTYGVDTITGDKNTDIIIHEFHTSKASTQSSNNITVTLGNITHEEVEAIISTSNNDQYMVRCGTKTYVQWYQNQHPDSLVGGQPPMDAMIYNLINNYYDKTLYEEGEGRFPLYRGDKQFDRNDQILMSPNRDYYMILVGFDRGVTSEIKLVPFTTAPRP